jgi:transcriptional regulator with XRE-family HTH domain
MTDPRRKADVTARLGVQAAGRAVAAKRGELGLTQAQVAVYAGVAVRTVGDLEAGRKWPWAKNLASIVRVLGLDAAELERIADGTQRPAKATS